MKVLLLNQAFYPDRVATAQILLDLARHLKEIGCSVTVVTGRRGYERRDILYPKRETFEGIEVHRVSSTGLGKKNILFRLIDFFSFDLALIIKLLLLPKQDVVISFTSPPLIGVIGAFFCLIRGGSSVQWLMDVNPDAAIAVGYLKSNSLLARFLTWLFRFSLRRSEQIVVLDRFMRDKIVAHGISEDKITIVPPWPVHGAEEEAAAATPERNNFREKHGLKDQFVVLYSGNHSVVHPLDTLLSAAIRLKNDPSVRFVFIGGGVRVRDVHEVVVREGLKNVIQLPPQPREALGESLSCADLHVVVMGDAFSGLVHTSKIYGVLATGKPYVFIGPAKSHVADLLEECPFGFHVENGDVEKLLDVIDEARSLPPEALNRYHQENTRYVRVNYMPKRLLTNFTKSVIVPRQSPEIPV